MCRADIVDEPITAGPPARWTPIEQNELNLVTQSFTSGYDQGRHEADLQLARHGAEIARLKYLLSRLRVGTPTS